MLLGFRVSIALLCAVAVAVLSACNGGPPVVDTPEQTATVTIEATATSTPSPTDTLTLDPTATPTPTPTDTPTAIPTDTSTPAPTDTAPEPTATSTPDGHSRQQTPRRRNRPTGATSPTPDTTNTLTPEPTATPTANATAGAYRHTRRNLPPAPTTPTPDRQPRLRRRRLLPHRSSNPSLHRSYSSKRSPTKAAAC